MKKVLPNVNKFSADKSGQFSMMLGLLAVPLVGAVGLLIDYSQILAAQKSLQVDVDSAVLAAAVEMQNTDSKGKAKKEALRFLKSNIETSAASYKASGIRSFNLSFSTAGETIKGEATMAVPTNFMGIFGHETVNVDVVAEAQFGVDQAQPVDLGIMLDVSGSMNYDGKLDGLKSATTSLMNELIGNGNTSENVRVAFAPFSSSVNAGAYANSLIKGTSSNGCIGERSGPNAHTDAAPSRDMFDVDGNFAISKDENGGVYRDAHFSGYDVPGLDELDVSTICPPAEIYPLTGDYQLLLNKLNSYEAAGITSGHLGVAWAWYLVSENWRGFWPEDSKPALNSERKKAVILMSDGEFNTYYQSGNSRPDQQTKKICKNMKADDVQIFAISLGNTGKSKTFLKNCASEKEFFFDTDNVSELNAAFLSIADNLKTLSYPILTQ